MNNLLIRGCVGLWTSGHRACKVDPFLRFTVISGANDKHEAAKS